MDLRLMYSSIRILDLEEEPGDGNNRVGSHLNINCA